MIVFFLGLTSVIYQIGHWRFSKKIIVHYGAMLMTVFPTLLLSGFYQLNSFMDIVRGYIEFNLAGILLVTLTYLIFKLVKKFNDLKTQ